MVISHEGMTADSGARVLRILHLQVGTEDVETSNEILRTLGRAFL